MSLLSASTAHIFQGEVSMQHTQMLPEAESKIDYLAHPHPPDEILFEKKRKAIYLSHGTNLIKVVRRHMNLSCYMEKKTAPNKGIENELP